jgi:osmotically-inducible protein OsmY
MARERLKSHGPVDDAVLEQRIRSHFGRKIRHARSVKVDVHEGQVVLSGPILRDEVGVLLDCVGRVPGVKGIENKLDVFDSAGQIPGLQGEGREYLQ